MYKIFTKPLYIGGIKHPEQSSPYHSIPALRKQKQMGINKTPFLSSPETTPHITPLSSSSPSLPPPPPLLPPCPPTPNQPPPLLTAGTQSCCTISAVCTNVPGTHLSSSILGYLTVTSLFFVSLSLTFSPSHQ